MNTKIKINSIFGKLIFEYECEENSIRKTILEAIKQKADLSMADLSMADFSMADLSGAYFSMADLSGAYFSMADLSGANLSGADLSGAYFSMADLSMALNKDTARLPIFCKWNTSIIADNIRIGCKEMNIENWDLFFESSKEFETKRNTEEFKQIQAVYLAHKAYLIHLKN